LTKDEKGRNLTSYLKKNFDFRPRAVGENYLTALAMEGSMDVAQLLVGHMGINLGSGNVFVSQHFLNTSDVRPGV
jgi:hypothetical protein